MIELLIELLEVQKSFGSCAVLRGISLSIKTGTTLGLIGESGSGKTTLAHLLLGRESLTGGQILFEGRDVASFSAKEKKTFQHAVQMVFQNPYSSLNSRMQIWQILEEPPRVQGRKSKYSIAELLTIVGLKPEDAWRYPHQFSGGELQRIAIARALAASPRLLIFDEPLASLDLPAQVELITLFQKIQRELGMTFFFISHQLPAIKLLATEVAILKDGKIEEMGMTTEIFTRPHSDYTRMLLKATPLIAF